MKSQSAMALPTLSIENEEDIFSALLLVLAVCRCWLLWL